MGGGAHAVPHTSVFSKIQLHLLLPAIRGRGEQETSAGAGKCSPFLFLVSQQKPVWCLNTRRRCSLFKSISKRFPKHRFVRLGLAERALPKDVPQLRPRAKPASAQESWSGLDPRSSTTNQDQFFRGNKRTSLLGGYGFLPPPARFGILSEF